MKNLTKRLTPLYITAFLQSFVLWYTIEKLFMKSIGFDDTGIGFMIAVYSIVMLAIEVPSGILADRWSRKGVLIIASVALAASSFICGSSQDMAMYLGGAIAWGIFFACYSGLYDSIIYDIVFEETGNAHRFDKYYGRAKAIESVGLVSSSIIGGAIAGLWNLQSTYLLTVPVALCAAIPLIKFTEPKLHKAEAYQPLKDHFALTFKAILKNRAILPVVIGLTTIYALSYMIYEFSQLWFIALATPAAIIGVANAALQVSTGIGGVVSSWLKSNKRIFIIIIFAFCTSGLGLIYIKETIAVVMSQVIFCSSITGLTIMLKGILHDNLTSKVRAGASSAVGSLSRLIVIPLALLFGYLSNCFGVFAATWSLMPLVVIVVAISYNALSSNSNASARI